MAIAGAKCPLSTHMPNSDAWALATLPKPRKAPAAGAWGRGVGSGIPQDFGRVEEVQTSTEPKEGDGTPRYLRSRV